jgi:hypothetical protein
MLSLSLLLVTQLATPSPVDSVQLITRDIANFWRAYDLAAGEDSAEQVRTFETIYLQPGSPGLRDWTRLRLMNRDTVLARLRAAGWDKSRYDSLPRDSADKIFVPFAQRSAAEELVRALARYPRFYASARAATLAVDTNRAITSGIRRGLVRLAELYPEARFPNIYFLIGTTSTGGTTGRSGMLIGTEQVSIGPDTPLDELPPWAQSLRLMYSGPGSLLGLVVHEAVHTQQKPRPDDQHDTLLRHALGEGIADFLAELAVGPWAANTPRQVYGRAHEHEVWVDFQRDMARWEPNDSTIRTWMYNGILPAVQNHGAIDIGYWVGYRIAGAYYARAPDKRAAVRALLDLKDPEQLLRASGYNP